ncbi:ammonium transporter [Deinococcus roseus]|uniref:Ammonium transporter n=1 Tax=Deinococcus roseus TaxID=392414 RepID=A0ABQ2D0T3_9DEIO|nr:ammonium transporter [Deinococcus roseus]GGJ38202.1 ammonium transporter [Deinococcus roseus]
MKHTKRKGGYAGTMTRLLPLLVLLSGPALAASGKIDSGDTAWVLASSALVLLMTPGLALFYGGLVSTRSVLNTMMMSFAAIAIVSVLWIFFGYSLAFGEGSWIGNLSHAGLAGLDNQVWGTIPEYVFVLFQTGFAIITPALISGAVVERMRFGAYLLFITLWSILVYIPLVHWLWTPNGWLAKLGVLDFAGGLPIEVACGFSGLIAAMMVGGRFGWPRRAVLPHNMVYVLLGVGLLWFGWLGFNAGSALTAGESAGRAITATNAAGASAMLSWMLWEYVHSKRATVLGAATGSIAGLVAVTPAAGFISPLAALLLGFLATTVSFWILAYKHKLKFDDSLDVFAVHGMGGVVGILFTGLFAFTTGQGKDPLTQFGVQALGLIFTVAFCAGLTFVSMKLTQIFIPLRVDVHEESIGVDLALHQESGYNNDDFGFSTQDTSNLAAPVLISSD